MTIAPHPYINCILLPQRIRSDTSKRPPLDSLVMYVACSSFACSYLVSFSLFFSSKLFGMRAGLEGCLVLPHVCCPHLDTQFEHTASIQLPSRALVVTLAYHIVQGRHCTSRQSVRRGSNCLCTSHPFLSLLDNCAQMIE